MNLGSSGLFFDELVDSPCLKDGDIWQSGVAKWQDVNALIDYLMRPRHGLRELFGTIYEYQFHENAVLKCVEFNITPLSDTHSDLCLFKIRYSVVYETEWEPDVHSRAGEQRLLRAISGRSDEYVWSETLKAHVRIGEDLKL